MHQVDAHSIISKFFPSAIYSLLAIYVPSFLAAFYTTSRFKIVADEVDIVVTEDEKPQSPPLASTASHSHNLRGSQDDVIEDIDIRETLVLEERGPHPLWTLLSGLPSPTSNLLSLTTAAINLLLVAAVLDVIYRGPLLHPSHDLSFTRVGYVTDRTARILLREPHLAQIPIHLSYRNVQDASDDSWKSAGEIMQLTNLTDFTSSVTIPRLKADTRYQYATSTNHSGFFVTAPAVGRAPRRNAGTFTFLTSSCIKPRFPYNPTAHPLEIPGLRELAKWIPELGAQFMLFLGDFIYIDAPKRFGVDIESYRRQYRMVYNSPDWSAVSRDLPWLHVLDDHEIANDWDRNTSGPYPAATDAWNHYHTSVNPPEVKRGASYYAFTQGPASFFMLDTRRYRSSELAGPANDTSKTMLGRQQLADLLSWLRRPQPAGVKWKVVASSVPFTKNWRFGSLDTWGGYLWERQQILEAMWDVGLAGGVGVVVVSGDRHEFAATSFPPPVGGRWPISATVHEFSTSPLSQFYLPMRTYRQDDDEHVMIKFVLSLSLSLLSPHCLEVHRLNHLGTRAGTFRTATPSSAPWR